MTRHKTVVFGLDGACFDLINPWINEGRLPTIKSIIEKGGQSELRSCVPSTTPPAWTSLTTGVNPGKHGIFGFYNRQSENYNAIPVSQDDVRAYRLWDYTSMANLTTLVVNIPVTHPAQPLQGGMVPGYLSPDPPETYPKDILSNLSEDYSIYAESEASDVPQEQLCGEWLALTDSRRRLSLKLMEEFDWDVLFLEFQKTDGAVHKFSDEELIARIYERVDSCINEVLSNIDEEPNTFLVSDHGIGQQKKWAINLNTWLVREGYAKTTTGQSDKNPWIENVIGGNSSSSQSITESLAKRFTSVGLSRQKIERLLSQLGIYNFVSRNTPSGVGLFLGEEVVEKAASQAFYQGTGFSGVDTGIVINDERFYRNGIVSENRYENLRTKIMESLRKLEGPDGNHPFKSIQRREEVYEGPFVELSPDIVLTQNNDYVIGSENPRGQVFIETNPNRVDHTRNGLLIASGPDIANDWETYDTPSIFDFTPTMLHLHDIPLNPEFDGRPLTELLLVDRALRRQDYKELELTNRFEYSSEEEEELRNRLKNMGYLE